MSTKKIAFKVLIVLFVLIFGALGAFDLYMRTTWDDNLFIKTNKHTGVIERYAHTFIANVRSDSIPEQYRKPIHIIERDGVFYWANNDNMPLYKSYEYLSRIRNGVEDKKGFHWVVFTNQDESLVVKIQGNDYLGFGSSSLDYGCYPRSWSGNVLVMHLFKEDLKSIKTDSETFESISRRYPDKKLYLVLKGNTQVYENIIQHYFCKK